MEQKNDAPQHKSLIEADESTSPKVLVVEDDKLLCDLMSTKLKSTGFTPMVAEDGLKALSLVKKFRPHVVILDLMLPGKDGYLILSDIRKDNEMQEIPVIVFSNKSDQGDIDRAMELGATKYYVKAMTDLGQLISEIESLCKA